MCGVFFFSTLTTPTEGEEETSKRKWACGGCGGVLLQIALAHQLLPQRGVSCTLSIPK